MHDGIHVEKAGVPSVTICTDAFVQTSQSMAAMWGTPDYPVIFTRHPIESLTRKELRARADAMVDRIAAIVTGT
ncbi:MAG: hypothetical protein L0177_00165 [Chloroflexi bacterium]|nr:hypothetical protein [Chloroflexota bacterium]